MFNFSRKDTEYFDLFVDNVKVFNQCAVLLDDFIKDTNKSFEKLDDIIELEKKADEINEKIVKKLNKSFITPIDREDIYSIAGEIATGIDMLQGALQKIIMYRAGHVTKKLPRQTRLLVNTTEELVKAFSLLSDIKKNQIKITEAVQKIAEYENLGDLIYRKDISLLFDEVATAAEEVGASKAVIHLIKWKDIIEDVEMTLDHCKKIADMIRGVVMKYA